MLLCFSCDRKTQASCVRIAGLWQCHIGLALAGYHLLIACSCLLVPCVGLMFLMQTELLTGGRESLGPDNGFEETASFPSMLAVPQVKADTPGVQQASSGKEVESWV